MEFFRKLFTRKRQSRYELQLKKESEESLTESIRSPVCFHTIWQRVQRTTGGQEEQVDAAVIEIEQQTIAKTVRPEEIANEILEYVRERSGDIYHSQNRLLLLEAIDFLATHKVQRRQLVREILSILYSYSNHIDRAILLFKCCQHAHDAVLDDETKLKRTYILENIAGWVVEKKKFPTAPFNPMGSGYYYLELPIRRAGRPSNTHVMAEALYRFGDPEFVLELLRHGTYPSCLYLWPMAVMLDLQFACNELTGTHKQEVYDLYTAS